MSVEVAVLEPADGPVELGLERRMALEAQPDVVGQEALLHHQ